MGTNRGPVTGGTRWRRWTIAALLAAVAGAGALCLFAWRGAIDRFIDRNIPDSVILSGLTDAVRDASEGQFTLTFAKGTVTHGADGFARIIVTDMQLNNSKGEKVGSAERLDVALDGLSLVGAQDVREITLIGPSTVVGIGADGRPTLLSPSEVEAPLIVSPDSSNATIPFDPRQIAGVLRLAQGAGQGEISRLIVNWSGGSYRVRDRRTGHDVSFSAANGNFARAADGAVTLTSRATGGGGEWSITATLGKLVDGEQTLESRVQDVPPQLMKAMLGLSESVQLALPVSALIRAKVTTEGALKAVSLQGGTAVSDKPQTPTSSGVTRIHELSFVLEWKEGDTTLHVPRFTLAVDDLRVGFTADLTLPNDAKSPYRLTVNGGQALTARRVQGEGFIPIDRMAASLTYSPTDRKLVVEKAEFGSGQNSQIVGQGEMTFTDQGPAVKVGIATSAMPVSSFMAFWPSVVSPKLRQFVKGGMQSGFIEAATIALNLSPGSLDLAERQTEPSELSLDARLSDVKMVVIEGLSPLKAPQLTIHSDGVVASVTIPQAEIETPSGVISFADMALGVPDHRLKPAPAKLTSRLDGSAEAVMAFLSSDYFKKFKLGLPEAKAVKGKVTGTWSAAFPLDKDLKAEQLDYAIDATLNAFSMENAVGTLPMEAMTLRLRAVPRELTLRGTGKLAGAPLQLDYRRGATRNDVQIKLATTLDQPQRARFGVELAGAISGPMPMKLSSVPESSDRFQIEVDLTPTAFNEPLPGVVKPAGQPGKARFLLTDTKKGWKIDDLAVETKSSLIRGALELDDKGVPVSGFFPAFHLSPGDKASLRFERVANGGYSATLDGDVFDARALLKVMNDNAGTVTAPGRGGAKSLPDFSADVKLEAMAGGNGEMVRKLNFKLARRNREWVDMTGTGQVGRAGVLRVSMQPGTDTRSELHVFAEDAGALLRFINIYPAMQGGQIAFVGPLGSDGTIRQAQLEIADFTIKGDEELSRMVAESKAQEGKAQAGMDAASFTRLRVNFSKQGGRLLIHEGLLWGPNLGATVEGELDFQRDRVSLQGTYVPAYALNNLIARLPVIGFVLGGGATEGLVGITYSISGKASSPRLNVNPLSAVTPGIFRKILDFRTQVERRPLRPDPVSR